MKWLMASLILLFALPVFAQTGAAAAAASGGIAVIDVQRVVQDSAVGKKALAEVTALKDKKQAEIDQKQNAIQAMQDKLDKQKDILSADAQDKLRDDIAKSVTDLRRFKEDAEQDIQNRLNAALKSMEDRVMPIIQKLGNDKGYSAIISKDQLIYYSVKNDVTDEVIRLFNEQSGAAAAQPKK